jgi:hypothetical protein
VRIGSIDIPEALLSAQASGQLVIFAGAGVSMPPPSSLPGLPAMISEATEGAGLSPEDGEPIDRFLGRLKESGFPVHRRVAEAVRRPSSEPTTLHYDLLKLFSSPPRVRLVTTNFDIHFTTAARAVFGRKVETYYAPALPLGHDFEGLVYLHGSAGKDARHIVLTDEDFGRAYLTEGWARRFLQNLLASYTVLFVGYSHSDPVMNYLSRGLPPEVRDLVQRRAVRRFALIPEGGQLHWRFLGVTPVEYPVPKGDRRHTALSESVAEWVGLLQSGGLDHEARMQAIVAEGPYAGRGVDDYLQSALREVETARYFFQAARAPAWLLWAEERGLLDPLFEGSAASPVQAEMATWFVERFLVPHPWVALAVARREGRGLGLELWRAALDRICSPEEEAPAPQARALWLELLLRSRHAEGERGLLGRLLDAHRGPKDDAQALLAFQRLAAPRLDLDPRGREAREDVGGFRAELGIELEGDLGALRNCWKRFFRPRLPDLAEALEPILAGHLLRVRLLSRAAGWVETPDGGGRRGKPGGDSGGEGVEFLLEVAGEVLGWLRENRPEAAGRLEQELGISRSTSRPAASPDRPRGGERSRAGGPGRRRHRDRPAA